MHSSHNTGSYNQLHLAVDHLEVMFEVALEHDPGRGSKEAHVQQNAHL